LVVTIFFFKNRFGKHWALLSRPLNAAVLCEGLAAETVDLESRKDARDDRNLARWRVRSRARCGTGDPGGRVLAQDHRQGRRFRVPTRTQPRRVHLDNGMRYRENVYKEKKKEENEEEGRRKNILTGGVG
jgi:hypothetical protein